MIVETTMQYDEDGNEIFEVITPLFTKWEVIQYVKAHKDIDFAINMCHHWCRYSEDLLEDDGFHEIYYNAGEKRWVICFRCLDECRDVTILF